MQRSANEADVDHTRRRTTYGRGFKLPRAHETLKCFSFTCRHWIARSRLRQKTAASRYVTLLDGWPHCGWVGLHEPHTSMLSVYVLAWWRPRSCEVFAQSQCTFHDTTYSLLAVCATIIRNWRHDVCCVSLHKTSSQNAVKHKRKLQSIIKR